MQKGYAFRKILFFISVQLRMVLRSNQTKEWTQITENVLKLDLCDLNSNPVLQENNIVVDSIEKGCLVVSFNTASGVPIQHCLKLLFEVLFEVLDIESTLQKNNVSEIRINGYVYCPEQFKEGRCIRIILYILYYFISINHYPLIPYDLISITGPNAQACHELFIIRHLSWTTPTTKCDVDIYVSKLMKNLVQGDFSTDGTLL